ncbi:MAG: M28 family peptidase [Planctomycetes bacterium]|nr:M28 family peptidase [Planctomycetota bacterium]
MGAPMRPRPWLLALLLLATQETQSKDFETGFASITEKDLLVHVTELASPQLEGRDSPSEGLFRAGEYIIGRLKAAGIAPGMNGTSYRMGYTVEKEAPIPAECALILTPKDGEETTFVLEEDFVPLPSCPGEGEGKLSFFGFGITESDEKRYDDLKGKNCKEEIVMILESEPRSKKLFEGPEITKAADVYTKVKALEERGARGVLVVRRPPVEQPKGLDGKPVETVPLGFRHSWAPWNYAGPQATMSIHAKIPVLEITPATAAKLLGEDVLELAEKIETSGKPLRRERKDVRVSLRAGLKKQHVPIDNIVGLLRGYDPALANEYMVMGAHYDHIGVDGWGRVGCGADDNGSGSSGLIEQAEAMALAHPKRSIFFCWFSSEEDGLDGSKAFCENPPVAMTSIVTMLNVDMIGRLAEDEVYVIGAHVNNALADVLKEAKKLKPTQIKKVFTDKGLDLWTRSDHFNFAEKGVPAMFFTEGAIDAENPDYHMWSDTVEKLSLAKMARISRFMFNTAWLIANNPERPPPSR